MSFLRNLMNLNLRLKPSRCYNGTVWTRIKFVDNFQCRPNFIKVYAVVLKVLHVNGQIDRYAFICALYAKNTQNWFATGLLLPALIRNQWLKFICISWITCAVFGWHGTREWPDQVQIWNCNTSLFQIILKTRNINVMCCIKEDLWSLV